MKKFFYPIFFFFFFFSLPVKAQENCPPAPPAPSCNFCSSSTETQYRCNGQCPNAKIEKRERNCQKGKVCSAQAITDEKGCIVDWQCVNCTSCDSCGGWSFPQKIEDCKAWQECKNGVDWSYNLPRCQCSGKCLEKPKNPRYYDNPTYSDQPEKSKDPNNIFLPVKLDWDDVKYWKSPPDGPASYKITIRNTTKGDYSTLLMQSEYNYREDSNAGACLLKSGFTHQWEVQACCGTEGKECGPTSYWQFTTNAAPEPVSPIDPDWEGSLKASDISVPVILDWCDVTGSQSWLFRIYLIEDGQEVCHPWLKINGDCGSELLRRERRPPPYPSEEILYSDFLDERGFFTKDTEYRWQIATCVREDGIDCSDFSQKWGFKTTTTVPLPSFNLVSPPNDPSGNNAVGLPITLDWEDKPGINSFIYEVNPGGITNWVNASRVTLNYPTLSLNTLYNWKVKPCWDYKGEKCEDWPKENGIERKWYFKTTGAPPNLIYPEPNATNIPIPVKLDWEDVSGAGSYKYEVSSAFNFDNIVAEGVVEKSEVSVYYPNMKQLTNYWWRVKTCADKAGNICGEWSQGNFRTFKLPPPSNLSPKDGEEIFTSQIPMNFSWNGVSGAKFYQYEINYETKSQNEKSDTCQTGTIKSGTTTQTSILVSLNCLGNYRWQVRACLDENCTESGDWNGVGFTFREKEEVCKPSLVPCGRTCDVEKTPWNERDSCEIKHLFLLLRNILDFFFWYLGLIILVLLILATAAYYYFSIYYLFVESTDLTKKIKSLWKAVGIGYGIIFFAWIIINLFLTLLGYKFQIFGHWWEIKF